MKYNLMALALMGAIFACTQPKVPVMITQDGHFMLTASHTDKEIARNINQDQANRHCQSKDQYVMLIDESFAYDGTFSEKESKIIRAVGNMGAVLGRPGREIEKGADAATEDSNYTAKLIFTCKPAAQ